MAENEENRKSFRRSRDREVYQMAEQALELAQHAMRNSAMSLEKIEGHESVCSERYGNTQDRLEKMTNVPADIAVLKLQAKVMIAIIATGTIGLIGTMWGVLWFLFKVAMKLPQ